MKVNTASVLGGFWRVLPCYTAYYHDLDLDLDLVLPHTIILIQL